jgi:4'-phosphopantetheinyl transferase
VSELAQARRAVHLWPDELASALADLRGGLTVIGRPLPLSASRAEARATIRQALRETLAALVNQPVVSVTLTSRPGQAIQLQVPGSAPGFASISHMPGFSVAAISCGSGPVGVDVMAVDVPLLPGWALVARDYLGPHAAAALHRKALAEQATAFAQAWVAWEARLKCLGLGLVEWTPGLALRLSACDVQALALPPGLSGALALR